MKERRFKIRFTTLMLRLTPIMMVLLAMAGPARGAESGDEQEVFESLYGDKLKQAQVAGPQERIALAHEMLIAAQTSKQHRGLVALLCQHAYDLTATLPEGLPTAIESMKLLASEVPMQRIAAHEQLADVYQFQFRRQRGDERNETGAAWLDSLLVIAKSNIAAGEYAQALNQLRRARATAAAIRSPRDEEVRTLQEWAAHRRRAESQLQDLEAKVQQQPNQEALAEQIVRGYLVDLDDPDRAAPYVAKVTDASLKSVVELAARDLQDLSGPELLQLADWYHSQSEQALGVAQLPLLLRARQLYERFLEVHALADLARRKAELALKEIRPKAEAAEVLTPEGPAAPDEGITVLLKVDCPEAPHIIAEVAERFPEAVEGIKQAELLRFHNAIDLNLLNGGSPARVAGSYANGAAVGDANAIMMGGPYEVLETGQYIVVYRIQYAGVVQGQELSFLDVCSEGSTVKGFKPAADQIVQGRWNALPVRLMLGHPIKVEYRLWPYGRKLAVDRVYIFKVQ